ncbi:MAG: hypothetical protein IKJ39_05735 [Lachnospiraceae bacterium]|nr:hypothetical protein [Lachnospiraceae bacterium]
MKGFKKRIWITLLIMLFVLAGCSEKKEVSKGQDTETSGAIEENQKSESVEENLQELTLEQIQALSEETVTVLYYYNQERDDNAGLCFAVDSPKYGKVLLKDAFRLWPYDGEVLESEKFARFVRGGELWNTETRERLNVFLKNCFLLDYEYEAVDKNVAAFTLQGDGELKTLKLATDMPQVEDKVYLLAGEQVYEGKVKDIWIKEAYYSFEGMESNKMGNVAGAPIVNVYGEVIGIYLGVGEEYGESSHFGIKLVGFGEKLEQAEIADITYSTTFVADMLGTEFPDITYFTPDQVISTHYMDMVIHGTQIVDELEGYKPKDGYKYLLMEVTFQTSADITDGSVQVYSNDFSLNWPDHETVYRETEELMYGQFPEEFEITDDETRGVFIYQVPADRIRAKLTLAESYPKEDSKGMESMLNIVFIRLENWIR